MVELQVHDFFAPQPIKNTDVFLLRQIVHDWPDGAVIKILAQLRAAAMPTTKLIIVDQIIPYATASDALQCVLEDGNASGERVMMVALGEERAAWFAWPSTALVRWKMFNFQDFKLQVRRISKLSIVNSAVI